MDGLSVGKIFPPIDFARGQTLDAILIPGNGLQIDGSVPPRVQARLEAGIQWADYSRLVVTLSRGTLHKPQVIVEGQPVYEADASKKYLVGRGIPQAKVIAETSSSDTLGNAYFARTITEDKGLRKLLLIVSESHVPRANRVFDWVFHLPPEESYFLHYLAIPDVGLSPEQVKAQEAWGQQRIKDLEELKGRILTFDALARYIDSDEYRSGTKLRPLPEILRNIY
ncbi:YdcF family protein [Candidatus Woesearchaeota archaeon]|nr:YdcF family protein [Candidatus Pacearchaeota archaeon]MBI4452238.1 YdcF family protein [Candidatus Woesearchaeota archaeon]